VCNPLTAAVFFYIFQSCGAENRARGREHVDGMDPPCPACQSSLPRASWTAAMETRGRGC
jgi:hypothetical protein